MVILRQIVRGVEREARRYDRRARSKFRKEQKRRVRQAANIVLRQARRNIKSTFKTHGKARARSGGKTLSQETKTSVRSRRGFVTAVVGAGGQPGAYGKVLEEGRTVSRKSRSGNIHQASYPKKPWLEPAVRTTSGQVFAIIGKTFRVV